MKNKEKSFDCVKMMRAIRDKISQEIANMTHEELIEYFRKRSEKFELQMNSRQTGT